MDVEPTILDGTDDWLVVDKPAGWHTLAGRSEGPSVEGWLREHVASTVNLHEAGLVHRLDVSTGGAMLVATNEAARVALREAMSGRGPHAAAIGKVYLAAVAGRPKARARARARRRRRARAQQPPPTAWLPRAELFATSPASASGKHKKH